MAKKTVREQTEQTKTVTQKEGTMTEKSAKQSEGVKTVVKDPNPDVEKAEHGGGGRGLYTFCPTGSEVEFNSGGSTTLLEVFLELVNGLRDLKEKTFLSFKTIHTGLDPTGMDERGKPIYPFHIIVTQVRNLRPVETEGGLKGLEIMDAKYVYGRPLPHRMIFLDRQEGLSIKRCGINRQEGVRADRIGGGERASLNRSSWRTLRSLTKGAEDLLNEVEKDFLQRKWPAGGLPMSEVKKQVKTEALALAGENGVELSEDVLSIFANDTMNTLKGVWRETGVWEPRR